MEPSGRSASCSTVNSSMPVWLLALSAAAIGFLLLRCILKRKSAAGLRVPNYERDKVYMFCFPTCRTTISISPFALKLETWLRLHKIPYAAVRRPNVWSSKGQIPFIELNGEEYNESNLIIARLTDHFKVDEGLSSEQVGFARGLEMMLDNQTFYSYIYHRFVEATAKFIATWEFLTWARRKFLVATMPPYWRRRVQQHGIGRNTVPEMHAMGCDDILALSRVLGNRKFLFGDRMTTVDCYAFGHLAQILFDTVEYPHKEFMKDKAPNLCQYIARIKKQIYPDWDQVCIENIYGSKSAE